MTIEIKICGLTRAEDARLAWEAGADYLGVVLYAGSPRGVTADAVQAIREALPAGARVVGVFVNESPAAVGRVAAACRLAAVQIHGDELPGGFEACGVPVWRAVRAAGGVWTPEPARWPAARYVADAAAPGLYGGSGQRTDWPAAAGLARRVPVMLAGGLTPGNVADAVRAVRPLGVDVSSGVERAPGIKDPEAVVRFIRAARAAAAELEAVQGPA